MLFDPDCSLDDVEVTLDMAERHLDLPWNLCRTEVYSGTELRSRLEAEGRLLGDYKSYGYRMRDERAEVMFRIVRVALHERALAVESLLNRLISLSFARQLHEHFFPGPTTEVLSAAATELGVAVRCATAERLRRIVDHVRPPAVRAAAAVRRFAVAEALDIGETNRTWRARCNELWQQLNARGVARMERAGVRLRRVRNGWGVAAGS